MDTQTQIENLRNKTKGMGPQEVLKLVSDELGAKISFATSLGEEDQVLTDMISKVAPGIEVFTLDTGRLFNQTYDLWAKNQKRYSQVSFKMYFPNTQAVEEMVKHKGVNLFYESVENRRFCCGVRKVEPLQRALSVVDAWVTGLRHSQSLSRTDAQIIEWDEANKKIKVNPLIDWSLDQVREYITDNGVDVNPLHAQGFVSIGCAPCTRAINLGEDIRTGRWWWELPEQKECGLHNNLKWKGNKQ